MQFHYSDEKIWSNGVGSKFVETKRKFKKFDKI